MKKILAILCAVMLVLTCSISVFAEGEPTYTIKIGNAAEGKTYNAYKMFDLVYSNSADDVNSGSYYYTVNAKWTAFFTGANASLISIDSNGTLTVPDVAALAEKAIEYVKTVNSDADDTNNIPVAATGTAVGVDDANPNEEVVLNLDVTASGAGYYFVDSNLGAICSLNTTNPTAEIEEKNSVPTVDKVINEGAGVDENTAMIGESVPFKSTITVNKGLEALTWKDTLSAGLTYDENLEIAGLTKDTDYTISVTADKHNITVVFTSTYLNKITTSTDIVITYSATVNTDAVIGGKTEEGGNTNTVTIIYGNDPEFQGTPVTTTTYVYSFDLVKTDSDNKVLDGAEFKLYDSETGGNEIKVVKISDGVYRVAVGEETGVSIVPVDGVAIIEGLAGNTTYYLEETVAPTGYNKITTRQPVTIGETNNGATVTDSFYQNGGVQVINNTGNMLPSTGGMGTTLFIAIGSIVVLITGVVLVARKRMSKYVA